VRTSGARPARPPDAPLKEVALNKDEKAEVVTTLTERLRGAPAVIATDFTALSVKQVTDLRRRLGPVDAEMRVVKNTLARRAAGDSGRDGLLSMLTGPTALVFSAGDPAAAAKVLADFAKEHPERLTLKGGLLDGDALDAAQVGRLAALPPREALLAQLAGGLAAPLTGLAGGLDALISGLARTLAALQQQRESESPAPA
jgi:large subunit ribosomal protein L10